MAARREREWTVARLAAQLLRRESGAAQVVASGSLRRAAALHARSDVDLAVWSLPTANHLRAVASVNDLAEGFGVDLVEIEGCRAALRETIEREGVGL